MAAARSGDESGRWSLRGAQVSQPGAQEDARGRVRTRSRRRMAMWGGSEWRRRGRRRGPWVRAAGAGRRPGGKGVVERGSAEGGGADRARRAGAKNAGQDEGASGDEDRREDKRRSAEGGRAAGRETAACARRGVEDEETGLGARSALGAHLLTGLGKGGERDGGKCGESCASYSQGEHGRVVRVAGRGVRGNEDQREDGRGSGEGTGVAWREPMAAKVAHRRGDGGAGGARQQVEEEGTWLGSRGAHGAHLYYTRTNEEDHGRNLSNYTCN